jgi:hypothetical protein
MPKQLIRPDLVNLICLNADKLLFPEVFVVDDTLEPVDKQIFLAAFSLNESSGGYNKTPKFEAIYAPGGRYFNRSTLQQGLYENYGEEACKSYSSFQIMLLIYHELGFTDANPDNAGDDSYALPVAIKLFNKRVFKDGKAKDINFLGMSGDSYNSGNWKDKNVPQEYLKRLIKHYHMAWDSNLFVPTVDKNSPKPW